MAVTTELDSYSDVCEALSTLEVALGFLAMTGGDPCMQLFRYLEEVLQMQNQVAPHILKVSQSEILVILSCCLHRKLNKYCIFVYKKTPNCVLESNGFDI